MGSPPRIRALRTLRCPRGTVVLEFALVAPIVILLFVGIAEFGRFYHARLTLQHAVREAGRFAVTGNTLVDPDTGQDLTRAESIRRVILDQAANLDLDVERLEIDPPDGGGPSAVVTVTAGFRFEFVAPGVRQMFPEGGHDFTISMSMQNEPFFDE